jgi:antitoxin YefM
MTKTLSLEKAQEDLGKLISLANKKRNQYVITVDKKPSAILMSYDEFESWKETMEIKSDPELVKDIEEGMEDIRQGRVYDWEDVKKELGWHVQDSVSRKNKKATQKTR